MKKEVVISIQGLYQTADEDNDSIELVTRGLYTKRNGSYYIRYAETEATGYAGCTTTLRVDGVNSVTISRSGNQTSSLIIEKNRRHQCFYNTPYGDFTVGVYSDLIESSLDDDGGNVHFQYTLDINAANTSVNNVTVSVKECKNHDKP